MGAYEKVKAWLALLVGVYLILQSVALIISGSVFTAAGAEGASMGASGVAGLGLGSGIFMLAVGLVVTYFSWKLASWGWSNI
jgi:hypothetical protein